MDIQEALSNLGRNLIEVKNRDYGDTQGRDPFANFRRHGLTGILVRMDDKLARMNTFAKTGRLSVKNESFMDAAIDLMNYAAIAVAFAMDAEARLEEEQGNVVYKRTQEDRQGSTASNQHSIRTGREPDATNATSDPRSSGSGKRVFEDRRSGKDRRGSGGADKGTTGNAGECGIEGGKSAGRVSSESSSPVAFR